MLHVMREDARQPEIAELIEYSDAYSASRYPEECRYPVDATFLARSEVRFFVARIDGMAVGCGAAVLGADQTVELKRIIVRPDARGKGVGFNLLNAIEAAVSREHISTVLLETGPKSQEALGLYRRCGHRERGPFGSYQANPHSVFMEKGLTLLKGPMVGHLHQAAFAD
jgi:putative acetyltransferase